MKRRGGGREEELRWRHEEMWGRGNKEEKRGDEKLVGDKAEE